MSERISAAEARDMLAKETAPDRRRVRGTKRCCVHGINFDSRREMERYLVLRDRQKKGEIENLRLQVDIPLHGRKGPILTPTGQQMHMRADFTYDDLIACRYVIEDAKGGYQTETSVMKLAILAADGVVVDLV